MDQQNFVPRSQREYDLQRDRTQAEISKLVAESRKLNKESAFYPFVAGAAFASVMLALGRILFA